jgi:hypothetical protein
MVIGGVGFFIVDQFNVVVVNGDKANIDSKVARNSAGLLVGGTLLYFLRKKSQKIHGRYRLVSVDSKSFFYEQGYRPEKGYISPYIPRNN